MTTNQSQGDDARLNTALREWIVDASVPPRFQDNVWQRIARAEARPEPQPSLWASLQRLVDSALPRPQIAFAYLATFLILGVTGGSVLAQHKSNRLESELGQRYVQSVNPYHAGLPNP